MYQFTVKFLSSFHDDGFEHFTWVYVCTVKFYWNCAHGNGFGERFRSNFIHVYDIYNRAHLYLAELNLCMFIAFILTTVGYHGYWECFR